MSVQGSIYLFFRSDAQGSSPSGHDPLRMEGPSRSPTAKNEIK